MTELLIRPSEYLQNCLKLKLSNTIQDLIDCKASIITFEKGHHPIQADMAVTSFYFMIYGIVRGYYIDSDGNEVTKCFVYENCFFGSECFRTNTFSTFYVECIEECKCIKLPYSLVNEIISSDIRIGNYVQNLYFEEISKLEERTKKLLLLSAEQQYINFCKEYPNLQNRLPLKYIASYIGIAVGSMSRIRKKLKNHL
ncbi:Crp/Fnr family transcriptional regulator [Clostridioides difficile]|nr:Crp/Fnr family transcriptional regulator [Clostridioides difficile]MCJ1730873.1 Crp/Fnr family transcriptional regulator [Clostridioides difficile]MCO4406287.1 Crp/Fnr family transcriptional regulator [Clostridioides difficile]SJN99329.1 Cyclic nucleotide-binding domain [Clostridioides difficile]SJO35021.1 Cyclic nucleotide-binding domain [Clostridioides difficile]SJO53899.1 Cyclic nucleotide-binding domain [Clostridioides difficile]